MSMSASQRNEAAEDIAARTLRSLGELRLLTDPGQGVNRLGYSPNDIEARRWFRGKCREIGLSFEIDPIGNCFGWAEGARGERPLVIGSHLDSVINAGAYDGTVGVALGFELVRWFVHSGARFPMGVGNFACEESTRFGLGTIGSRYLVGELDESQFSRITDFNGDSLEAVLAQARLAEFAPSTVPFDDGFASCYIEVHIDQGTLLRDSACLVGTVTDVVGVSRTALMWKGQAAHSGGQARRNRRNALLAAADYIVQVDLLWRTIDTDGDLLACTVGQLTVSPNSPNTIPGLSEMIVDIRGADGALLDTTVSQARSLAREVAAKHGVDVEIRDLGRLEAMGLHPGIRAELESAAKRAGVRQRPTVSLSAHDAMVIGRYIPAGMLLLSNPNGLSHNPDEGLDEGSLVDAAGILLEAIPTLAEAA